MIEIEQKFSGIEEKLKEVKHVYKQWKTKVICNLLLRLSVKIYI